ncbi:MAG TPA: LysR substrate-binding domain-containing protein [Devosiaceae bacterium]|nr:LysR substrate-binding domain-containing protein [Devosiaceae bacterium]
MFEPIQLKSFLAVVETRSFTEAARRLGLSQPTISNHVRRLEIAVGRALLARDTHTVTPTSDGNVMATYARDIVAAMERAAGHFLEAVPRGRLRLGISEDLVLTRLPEILRQFIQQNPQVDLDLTVGLTTPLYEKLDSGRLDLIFTKRRADDPRGQVVWTERLAWIANRHLRIDQGASVPLVVYTSSSITGDKAIDALNRSGMQWHLACSSGSLSGIRAATLAGLGVTAQSRLLLSDDLVELPPGDELPLLDEIEFVVLGRSIHLAGSSAALASLIKSQAALLAPATSTGSALLDSLRVSGGT